MRKRSSRRLAGCIVIELALAATGLAADYRAGAAASGSARALVLEDARGNRAVFTQTEFRITQALADFVAARLLVALDLQRPGLLFHWSGIGARPEQPEDLVTAITTAVNALEAAEVRYGHRSLSVAAGERCRGKPESGRRARLRRVLRRRASHRRHSHRLPDGGAHARIAEARRNRPRPFRCRPSHWASRSPSWR